MACSYSDYLCDLSLCDADDEMESEIVFEAPIDPLNKCLFDLDLDFFDKPMCNSNSQL